MPTRATSLGWRGEAAARAWLERRGLTFVQANFRVRGGEIDMIMRDRSTTVFVEVKTRRSRTYGWPEESISPRKLERLRLAVESYCVKHSGVRDVRLDLVVVERIRGSWQVRHLPGLV